MRHLYYVPIIHTEADLGSLAQVVKRSVAEAQTNEWWADRQRSIEAKWASIRDHLLALPISWPHTRIYQDALPICNGELAIVNDIAAKGSLNHQLLLEMVERGATVMGTENPQLLIRDYQRVQRLVRLAREPVHAGVFEQIKREGDELLRLRDTFIAQRIDTTLQAGEVGILLIGLMHRVDEYLGGRGICLHRLDLHQPAGANLPQKSESPKL